MELFNQLNCKYLQIQSKLFESYMKKDPNKVDFNQLKKNDSGGMLCSTEKN